VHQVKQQQQLLLNWFDFDVVEVEESAKMISKFIKI
jgi:hypothetical protein